ncbi:5288_t:CDS:2 [Entrophospora sp. SA101]|nr:5288_t:CDS:2 [Entrophospora sp. SA101]
MPSSGSSHIVKGILLSIVACSEYIIIETICRRCVAVDGNGQATFPKELFLTSGTEFGVNIRLSSLESSYIAEKARSDSQFILQILHLMKDLETTCPVVEVNCMVTDSPISLKLIRLKKGRLPLLVLLLSPGALIFGGFCV